MAGESQSWSKRLLRAAWTLVGLCVALYIAAQLVLAVWPVLLVVSGVIALFMVIAALLRRPRGW